MRKVLPSLLCAALVLSACGGGGGSGGANPLTILIQSAAALDGSATAAGGVDTTLARVGDVDQYDPMTLTYFSIGVRGFWSFELGAIPAGATILAATLSTAQTAVQGGPYAGHGLVTLDHLDYGSSLDSTDYDVAPLAPAFATLSPDATLGVKSADVTAQVQADRAAGRTRSQYRAHFSVVDTDSSGSPDYVDFTTSEFVTDAPLLIITYQP